MRENADQNNFEFGHFSRSGGVECLILNKHFFKGSFNLLKNSYKDDQSYLLNKYTKTSKHRLSIVCEYTYVL